MKKSTEIHARALMVQGTASHAGKSLITAGILRILRDMGLRVAPFKAQNMALNSFVTEEGGEMGRAQALQAMVAGVRPTCDMNPILLKPTDDSRTQVIIHGRVYRTMSALEYHSFKKEARRFVLESYTRLAGEFDVVVIEGAGSPAEINLRDNDIANMGVAEMVDCPVVLVGDIDRGGVFASIVGTLELLEQKERERIRGLIINKFRGDRRLLEDGIDYLERRTGVSVVGVIPYMKDLNLPEEDGVSVEGKEWNATSRREGINIHVIRLPRISNFTDFDPLKTEKDVTVRYIHSPVEVEGADLVVIPGSKNTIKDLLWFRERGFVEALGRFMEGNGMVAGICGGFQMLGRSIKDPLGVESEIGETMGLSFLDTETVLTDTKKTFQVMARIDGFYGMDCTVRGYEIHMGETTSMVKPFARIERRNSRRVDIEDGGVSADGNTWGTYIHGIFDNDRFRTEFLDILRRRKGLPQGKERSFLEDLERSIAMVSDTLRENLDMNRLLDIIWERT